MVNDLLTGRKHNILVDLAMVTLAFASFLVLILLGVIIQITDRVIPVFSNWKILVVIGATVFVVFVGQPSCKLVDPPPTPAPTPTFGIPRPAGLGGN